MKSLTLYASQLASYVGKHKFKKPHDALQNLWNQVSPSTFLAAHRRNGSLTTDMKLDQILSSNSDVRTILVASERPYETSTEASGAYRSVLDQLDQVVTLNEEERAVVMDEARKTVYTSFGNAREAPVLEDLQHRGIDCREDPATYRQHLMTVNGIDVIVSGRVDAMSSDGKTVIEIKNRVHRLFHRIPTYERIQLETYLRIVPGVDRGVLVECLTRPDHKYVNTFVVTRDDALWDEVLGGLEAFVRYFLKVLGDPLEQDAFLREPVKTLRGSVSRGSWTQRVDQGQDDGEPHEEDAQPSKPVPVR